MYPHPFNPLLIFSSEMAIRSFSDISSDGVGEWVHRSLDSHADAGRRESPSEDRDRKRRQDRLVTTAAAARVSLPPSTSITHTN